MASLWIYQNNEPLNTCIPYVRVLEVVENTISG
jgi:hypothetical protein